MPLTEPKVSVIIPVYNVEAYLEECLESVCKQTLHDIEIICVNDGSTDRSVSILERYAHLDTRIRIISQENQGLSAARNAGLDRARGNYISFLDSDDKYADETVLFVLYERAKQMHTELLCTDLKVQIEVEHKFRNDFYQRHGTYEGIYTGQQLFCEMMQRNEFFNLSWLLFLHREWLMQSQIRFYPGIFYEDILFSFFCYMNAKRAAYIKKECYIYRVRKGSIMNQTITYKHFHSYMVCYREMLKEILNQNWPESVLGAVRQYMELIQHNVRTAAIAAVRQKEDGVLTCSSVVDEILADSLGIEFQSASLNHQIYLDGFERLLENCKQIYIYGAGQVGLLVYRYLKDKNWGDKINCFCRTSQSNKEETIEELPVKSIYDIQADADGDLLILAVKKNYQGEMLETLKPFHYRNVVVIDDRLEQMIEHNIE